jgi:electron transport complex protein RnfC
VWLYIAVIKGLPLIERTITITGKCVKRPGNYNVPIGMLLKDIINGGCQGFLEEPAKVISGGPMMGMAQYTLDVPVIKGMSGIVCLTEKEACLGAEGPCLNCGKCVDVCPVNLLPTKIARAVKFDKIEDAQSLHIEDCMECGSCTYKCPAHIPIVHYVKIGKQKIRKAK